MTASEQPNHANHLPWEPSVGVLYSRISLISRTQHFVCCESGRRRAALGNRCLRKRIRCGYGGGWASRSSLIRSIPALRIASYTSAPLMSLNGDGTSLNLPRESGVFILSVSLFFPPKSVLYRRRRHRTRRNQPETATSVSGNS